MNTLFSLFWQRQDRFDLALRHLSDALALDPGNPLLIAEMGAAMSALGDVQTAINLFSEAVQQEPENPVYWQFLAKFSIQSEIQVEDIGLPAARQAHLLDASNPDSLALIGQAHLVLGNTLLAERFLLRAIETDPTFAPASLDLASLYLAEGDRDAARFHVQRVLDLAPDSPEAERALKILELYLP